VGVELREVSEFWPPDRSTLVTPINYAVGSIRFSRGEELLRLFAVAIVGLTLSSAMVWLLAELLRLDATLAKMLAVLPVLAWNYLGRRSIVYHGAPAAAMILMPAKSSTTGENSASRNTAAGGDASNLYRRRSTANL
jgi:hypothetical protein